MVIVYVLAFIYGTLRKEALNRLGKGPCEVQGSTDRWETSMMQWFEKISTGNRLNKWLTGIGACLFLYTIVGFVLLPSLFKWVLAKKLTEQLHRPVTIEDVDVNPYVLSSTLQGVSVGEPKGPGTFFSFDQLYANMQILSVFKRAPILRELTIEGLYVSIVRDSEGEYNFSDLMKRSPSEPQGSKAKSTPVGFSLNNIQLLNGHLQFLDMPENRNHQVTDLNITIPFISNLPHHIETFVEPSFSANINERPVSFIGKTKPFADSVKTILEMTLDDIDIPYYLAYLPVDWQAKVLSGRFKANISLSYMQPLEKPPALSVAGDIFLKTLEIVDAEERPLLNFPLMHISIASLDLISKNFHLAKVLIESPEVQFTRDASGELNIHSIIPAHDGKKRSSVSQDSPTSPTLTLDEIGVHQGTFVFSDSSVGSAPDTGSPVTLRLDGIDVTAQDISTLQDTKGEAHLACRLNGKAPLSAQATVRINPFSADVDLTMEGVKVTWLEPYFTDYVKIMVTNGTFSTVSKLTVSQSPDKGLGVRYGGKAALSGFSSVDKRHADEFVKWGSLDLRGIDLGYNPTYIRIKEVALSDFYTWIIVDPEGNTNIQTVTKEKKKEVQEVPPAVQKQEIATPVSVGSIVLKDGRISFLDQEIEPHYSSDLVDIKGVISGLSSEETATAGVLVEGKLNGHASLEVRGKINPLAREPHVDLVMALKDIDLSSMSPYAGKYVGQTLEKGKLFLELEYMIEKRKLDAENRVFIDQLTLGDRVESPDAVSLPVGLAVALLKDRKGEIHLDLPISGRTDDPEFSLGKVIVQVLTNLLTKAATSPFSLLGAMLPGGGEQVNALEFDVGSYSLTEETRLKLDAITKVLYERPSLRLDIEGHVDLEKDREGLRQYLFNKKLKALKLKKLVKKGTVELSVDEVPIEADEYEKYLKRVYKAEEFEKPRNALGLTKQLPVPEMERLILQHIEVTDNDLRLLALKRAQRVKDYILQSGKIEPERIFLVEAKSLAPGARENMGDSRVDLKLK
jgi:hypothetical protein